MHRADFLFSVALMWSALLCGTALAQAETTYPAKLSRQERLQLEQMVCGDRYGLAVAAIYAQAFEANGQAHFADVRCRPHAQLHGRPLYYVAQCGRDGRQWRCDAAETETSVALKERELIVRPGSVAPDKAADALRKISGYGFFQGNSIDRALESTCNLGMGDRPDLMEISCRKWSVTVSFWCPQISAAIPCPRVIYMRKHK